uniref:small monomeric GTPase n=1 Tax=Timema genevievae TaxID=629358 RepID=A0A7R9K2Q7_TIMGE|nr:unnamed protein product [Timema genevievae]
MVLTRQITRPRKGIELVGVDLKEAESVKCLGSVIEAKQSSREDMRQGQQGERKLGLWIKEKRLKVEAMGMTLAVTRRDRIRNEDVRSRVGVHEIVEEARMRWYGHIMRMEGEEDSKKINGYEVCREEMGGTEKCLGSVIEAKQSSREDMRQGQQGEDLPNAMNAAEITDKLGLHSLRNRNWYIQATCATSGDGLYEGLDWLSNQLKNANR